MNKLATWIHGLRGKLLLSAIFPVFAFIAISGLNIHGLSKMGDMLNDAYNDVVPTLDSLGHMSMSRQALSSHIWGILANADEKEVRTELVANLKTAFANYAKYQQAYEATPFSQEESKNYEKVKENKETFNKATADIITALEKNTPEEDLHARMIYKSEWKALADTIAEVLETNGAIYQATSKVNAQKKDELYRQNLNITILAMVCAIFALISILMMMAQKISRIVENIAIALSNSGSYVTDSIQQLTASGQTLSQSSTAAAASLEETVASLEEMSSMVKMNSDNAKQASALSQTSRDSAEQGEKEIQNLIVSMKEISASSRKIEDIINVIDDIAFQTNLLALNAAVEAARAGEQGKGFAVVADAVRTLAQKSAVAAKDITVLIKDSVDKIEKGTKIADQSGTVLNNIVTSVKKVADLNQEISAASSEQSTGITQVGKAMNQLDQSTQTNAASAEEIAASAEEILQQSQLMQEKVRELNMVIIGIQTEVGGKTSPQPKKTPAKKNAQVVSIETKKKAKATKPSTAAKVIPFDEDENEDTPRGKVGTTDGF